LDQLKCLPPWPENEAALLSIGKLLSGKNPKEAIRLIDEHVPYDDCPDILGKLIISASSMDYSRALLIMDAIEKNYESVEVQMIRFLMWDNLHYLKGHTTMRWRYMVHPILFPDLHQKFPPQASPNIAKKMEERERQLYKLVTDKFKEFINIAAMRGWPSEKVKRELIELSYTIGVTLAVTCPTLAEKEFYEAIAAAKQLKDLDLSTYWIEILETEIIKLKLLGQRRNKIDSLLFKNSSQVMNSKKSQIRSKLYEMRKEGLQNKNMTQCIESSREFGAGFERAFPYIFRCLWMMEGGDQDSYSRAWDVVLEMFPTKGPDSRQEKKNLPYERTQWHWFDYD
jgi:hypothetical protein